MKKLKALSANETLGDNLPRVLYVLKRIQSLPIKHESMPTELRCQSWCGACKILDEVKLMLNLLT